jgi:hypothetical protein
MKKELIHTTKILITAFILSLGISTIYAWTAPTQAPPAGNTLAPINVGATGQTKSGNLGTTGNLGANDGYFTGDVGIGTKSPTVKLEVAGSDALINGLTVGKGGGSGAHNTAVGESALQSNTTGISNTAIGHESLLSNTKGGGNIAIGDYSMLNNTTGSSNTAIGDHSMLDNTTGIYNTAVGSKTLYYNTTGFANTALGFMAGNKLTTGQNNVFLGFRAGQLNTNGNSNVFLGDNAGFRAIGSNNVFLGSAAGLNTNGDSNVFIGFSAGHNETGSNKLYIDNSSTASPLVWGDFATNKLKINGALDVTGNITASKGGDVCNSSGDCLNTTQIRVSGSCPAGSSIRSIAVDGTVTCETDDVGTGGIPCNWSGWMVTGRPRFSNGSATNYSCMRMNCSGGVIVDARSDGSCTDDW